MNTTTADDDKFSFWIADMFHYTVAVDAAGDVTAVWHDDLDHPKPALEWEAQSGQPPGKDALNAISAFRSRETLLRSRAQGPDAPPLDDGLPDMSFRSRR
jgi:hypothetical protein